MLNQLTEEQKVLLAAAVRKARDRARAAWEASDQTSNDAAFSSGFEAGLEFVRSEAFGRLISQLKSMQPTRH